ncbi:heme ABC transporter ATP-binding protein [Aurantimonas sp. MSK8Z-1]|nr:heme ABC transporter ATP-binding protein [Aurantimonas sp. MSK8Z-1]MCW4114353.1 heme ABC transporter ATP-binding protein [Aurantimonas sp. MSK8Z-1]
MLLTLDDVCVRADGQQILGPVSIALQPRTLTAVVGPNGAGKSTLVKAMSGEIHPATGRVRLDGDDVATLAPAILATRRAVLPQASAIAFPFTVFEIVQLGLRQRGGLDASARRRIVAEALAIVDLARFGDRLYPSLSGGEQQRTQLARVLCQIGAPVETGRAKLLILDEPTASLDVRHQVDVLAVARRFADAGGAVVAVLHDLNLAAGFADRVLLMQSGRIVADEAPEPLLAGGQLADVFGIRMVVLRPAGWLRSAVLPDFPSLALSG